MTEPKSMPISFSSEMVRAILDNRKTMTRRKFGPKWAEFGRAEETAPHEFWKHGDLSRAYLLVNRLRLPCHVESKGMCKICDLQGWVGKAFPIDPRYVEGDILWVREGLVHLPKTVGTAYDATTSPVANAPEWKWKRDKLNAMFMPRWASRIDLEVTASRIERLQEISEEDAIKEGVEYRNGYWLAGIHPIKGTMKCWPTAQRAFRELWNSLYGPGAWESNQWVVVPEFKRIGE